MIKIIIILLIEIITVSVAFAQETDLYKLQFSNGVKQEAIKIKIKKDSIYFYDLFNLEHTISISKVKIIKKIKNQKNTKDVFILKDDTKLEGIILEINPLMNYCLLSVPNDTLKISINKLKLISKKIINKLNFRKNKYELGVSLGFPAAINFMVAIWFDDFGIRLSGLHIEIAKGGQLNFCYKISENQKRYHSIAFVIGNSDIKKDKFGRIYPKNFHWQYAGIVYDLNYGDFWSELGMSYGYGNYNNPQIIFQFGYSAKIF